MKIIQKEGKLNNNQFENLLKNSFFFNQKEIVKPAEEEKISEQKIVEQNISEQKIVEDKMIEDKKPNLYNLPKLNICSGPNVFPFPGWINYDREDISSYLRYLDWQDENKTLAYLLHEMPEHQQKLANFIRSGNKIDFRVHDVRKGFPDHADNSVGFIYLGQAIEHLNVMHEVPKLLKEFHRILIDGGILRMTTPDLDLLINAYINNDMDKFSVEQPDFYKQFDSSAQLAMIMFGACGAGCTWTNYDGHFFLYTKKSMTKFLKDAGFKEIEFYYETGKGKDQELANEVVDAGMTHSFIVEAIK